MYNKLRMFNKLYRMLKLIKTKKIISIIYRNNNPKRPKIKLKVNK